MKTKIMHPFTRSAANACAALILTLLIGGCGKKKDEAAEPSGPQSPQGSILESVQKTADEANERTRKTHERVEKALE